MKHSHHHNQNVKRKELKKADKLERKKQKPSKIKEHHLRESIILDMAMHNDNEPHDFDWVKRKESNHNHKESKRTTSGKTGKKTPYPHTHDPLHKN